MTSTQNDDEAININEIEMEEIRKSADPIDDIRRNRDE